MKTIKELKKAILKTKREDKELSASYAAILKQVEAKTIGVANAETDEVKLIIAGAKKELKEQEQSKSAGAPFSQKVMDICLELVKELGPKVLSQEETSKAIDDLINAGNTHKGKLMGILKGKYKDTIDMSLANKILSEKL